MRRVLATSLIAMTACAVDDVQETTPLLVDVEVSNPFELNIANPMGIAVVWTSSASAIIGTDSAVEENAAVQIDAPDGLIENILGPVESVRLWLTRSIGIYRPRMVVYEDVDRSGHFDLPVLGGDGVDRVLAIDDNGTGSIGYVLNLEDTLERLSLEETGRFYQLTDDQFSPFVRVQPSSTVAPSRFAGLQPGAIKTPITLRLSESNRPQSDLECFRRIAVDTSAEGATLLPSARADVNLIADAGISLADLCGVELGSCVTEDFSTIAPSLEEKRTDGVIRIAQCRRNDLFEAVTILEANLVCEDCICRWLPTVDSYVISSTVAPTWWPCDASIPYCESPRPLYEIDGRCDDSDS